MPHKLINRSHSQSETMANTNPRVVAVLNHLRDRPIIGILGENRENVQNQNQHEVDYDRDYSLGDILRTIIEQQHGGGGTMTLLRKGGEPVTTGRTTTMTYSLIVIMCPGKAKLPPSLVAVRIPDGDEEHIIRGGHLMRLKHGGQFLVKNMDTACNMEFVRVHEDTNVLISHQRPSMNSTRAMSVNEQLTEEHTDLFTQMSEYIESVDFNFPLENGEVSTLDVYYMDDEELDVTGKAREVVAEYAEDGIDDEIPGNTAEEKIGHVRNAIDIAIEEARGEKSAARELLEGSGYDQDTLTSLRVYKIYPNNYEGNLDHYFNRFYGNADIVYAGNRDPSVRVRNNP